MAQRTGCHSGGGNDGRFRRGWMNGETDWPEGKTVQRDGLSGNRRVLARTRHRRATGNGNGHTLDSKEPVGKKLLGLTS